MDYIEIGLNNAKSAGYTAEQITGMSYDDIHALCNRNKGTIYPDVFVWESARENIANELRQLVVFEAEDGTIIQ